MVDWVVPTFTLLGVAVGSVIQYINGSRDRRYRSADLLRQIEAQRAISERQILASIRSSHRQAWIDGLRNDVAQCLSIATEFLLEAKASNWRNSRELTVKNLSPDLRAKLFEVSRLIAMIDLRLNPTETDHIELINTLKKLLVMTEQDAEGMLRLQTHVIGICQRILKTEWNRVSQGE